MSSISGTDGDLDQYIPVAERIAQFYQRFPLGRVSTRLVEHSRRVVIVQASVFRSPAERLPSATGWAAERPGDSAINTVGCLENAETSAIGRALANLGLSGKRQSSRPTRSPSPPARLESLGVTTIYGQPPLRPIREETRHQFAKELPLEGSRSQHVPSFIVRDLLRLLDDAERHGMRTHRATEYRRRITEGRCGDVQLERFESALRNWVSGARDRNS